MLIYNKHHILFPYNPHTNLPTKHTVPGLQWFSSFHAATVITPPPNQLFSLLRYGLQLTLALQPLMIPLNMRVWSSPHHSNLTEV